MPPMEIISYLANERVPGGPPPRQGRGEKAPAADLATRILIIEDEMMIAWMIESLLVDAGFSDIAMAATANEAQRLARDAAPGLIISDINLGDGGNGVEISQTLCRAARAPVIFVTAYASADVRDEIGATLPGAQLLRKPVEERALLDAVRRALATVRPD